VPKDGSSIDGSGGSQDQIGSRHDSYANDEAKHNIMKGQEVVAREKNKAQGEKTEIRVEAGVSSQQPPIQTIRFLKVQEKGGL
jgi:hypothetical protein